MKNDLILEKRLSDKSHKEFLVLSLDLGYKVLPITFNDGDIASITGLTMEEVYNRKVGDKPLVVSKLVK